MIHYIIWLLAICIVGFCFFRVWRMEKSKIGAVCFFFTNILALFLINKWIGDIVWSWFVVNSTIAIYLIVIGISIRKKWKSSEYQILANTGLVLWVLAGVISFVFIYAMFFGLGIENGWSSVQILNIGWSALFIFPLSLLVFYHFAKKKKVKK